MQDFIGHSISSTRISTILTYREGQSYTNTRKPLYGKKQLAERSIRYKTGVVQAYWGVFFSGVLIYGTQANVPVALWSPSIWSKPRQIFVEPQWQISRLPLSNLWALLQDWYGVSNNFVGLLVHMTSIQTRASKTWIFFHEELASPATPSRFKQRSSGLEWGHSKFKITDPINFHRRFTRNRTSSRSSEDGMKSLEGLQDKIYSAFALQQNWKSGWFLHLIQILSFLCNKFNWRE